MQALYDLIPVLLFFATFKWLGIYAATSVLIVATVAQVAWQYFRHRKVSGMLLTTAALVLVFGGLTLYIHDDRFIVWKPSVLYVLLAAAFVASNVIGEQPMLQRTLGHVLRTDRRTWQWATAQWGAFFLVLAPASVSTPSARRNSGAPVRPPRRKSLVSAAAASAGAIPPAVVRWSHSNS